MSDNRPTRRASRGLRNWGIGMTVLWGLLAAGGWLPGQTILLGFMTSAPPIDVVRTVLALAFALGLFVRGHAVLAGITAIAGFGSAALGLVLMAAPNLWGLVPTAATLLDSIVFLVTGILGVFVWASWRGSEHSPRTV